MKDVDRLKYELGTAKSDLERYERGLRSMQLELGFLKSQLQHLAAEFPDLHLRKQAGTTAGGPTVREFVEDTLSQLEH